MPTYQAECQACQHEFDYIASVAERYCVPKCPKCNAASLKVITQAPAVYGDLNDFSTENGGKGRYNHQLKEHVTSVDDAIAKADKRGWGVLDKA